jgi:hypothetical protein
MANDTGKPANGGKVEAEEEARRKREQEEADDAGDPLNDARALQQMIEGVPDSSDEFKRIEQKEQKR